MKNENVKSEGCKDIYCALLNFQRLVKPIGKDTVNPFFKSKYSSLDTIQEAIKEPLLQSGLVVVQGINEAGSLKTTVIHADSNTMVECFFPIAVVKATAQDYGSAMSYAKRYSLSAILNLTIGGEDDDGNHATKTHEEAKVHNAVPANTSAEDTRPWLSEKAYEQAVNRINEGDVELLPKLKETFRMKKAYREELERLNELSLTLK